MIQINCNIIGITEHSKLFFRSDSGSNYNASLESSSRAIFKLDDKEANELGDFVAANQVIFEHYLVPSKPGSYEGPTLELEPLVQELHIVRDQFLLPNGENYNWKGHQDMMLFKRSLDGEQIEDLLAQRFDAGSRCVVTLMMAWFIERFIPAEYGTRYFEHIEPFANAVKNAGFYWMPIVFADAQIIMPDKSEQITFLNNIATRFSGKHWILPSLANEYQKNGCDPSIFNKPNGNLWSRGSNLGDEEPFRPGWDWKEWHPRRDWPKVLFGNDDMWYVKEGLNANGSFLDYPKPTICSEPIGFWNIEVPGRRSTDPNLARVIGGTSVYFGRGGNFMSQQGLKCEPWDNVTFDCAVKFFDAINQF